MLSKYNLNKKFKSCFRSRDIFYSNFMFIYKCLDCMLHI